MDGAAFEGVFQAHEMPLGADEPVVMFRDADLVLILNATIEAYCSWPAAPPVLSHVLDYTAFWCSILV